jgi:hypothetical protein
MRRLLRIALSTVFVATTLSSQALARPPRRRARSTEARWYGADPHVPLAAVVRSADGAKILSEGWVGGTDRARGLKGPCKTWSRIGGEWNAIDRWGQRVGVRRLDGREYYDATGCFEVGFPDDTPEFGARWHPSLIVLYESGGDWRPRPSAEWRPSRADREAHERFVAELTALLVDPKVEPEKYPSPAPSPEASTMYFHAVQDPVAPYDPTPPRDRQFAVSGGRVLILAERGADGRWFAPFIDSTLTNTKAVTRLPYRPIAVVDMDGDAWPEIVCHELEMGGEFFGDTVISRGPNGEWRFVARSIGGSTA